MFDLELDLPADMELKLGERLRAALPVLRPSPRPPLLGSVAKDRSARDAPVMSEEKLTAGGDGGTIGDDGVAATGVGGVPVARGVADAEEDVEEDGGLTWLDLQFLGTSSLVVERDLASPSRRSSRARRNQGDASSSSSTNQNSARGQLSPVRNPDVTGFTSSRISQRQRGQLGFRTSHGRMQTPWKKEQQPLP
jgi:hypothetical protein